MSTKQQSFDLGRPSSLTVYDVASYETSLLEAIATHNHISLDLSGIEEVDSAGLQWLMHLEAAAAHNEIFCEVSGPSPMLEESAALLGLSKTLFGAIDE